MPVLQIALVILAAMLAIALGPVAAAGAAGGRHDGALADGATA